ncbi:XRE family transcriptional regulator [Anaerotruncus sp. 80]|uniref:XRE family transcriptional regulator n=1 Tax=Anaerotruncus colihominis TaxID=169435 RepID=A0A845QNQ3_9FIRM|nr:MULTISPECIES: helix-turn-helix transcriptional regulator [Anaerotruncus]NBH62701.1 XRE family transcriptional regulator [Anaerotruncus colihominis]NCF03356.1 XRE family transcriptional regulator [Anaerotruncus sp. 80]
MNKTYIKSYKNLGLNIAFYRKKQGLTQLQLAELLDIDRSHMSAIELATVGVSLDVIFKLCEVLEITPKELFDFRD